ncbi:reverse transcriptase domain-containing protein [Tanacetum coccineum]
MCPHIRDIQGTCHIIVVAEIRKAATKVLTPGKQKLLPRNIIAKEHPRKERKHCQKVKAAQDDIGSQNQKSQSRALRTTYPNHSHIKTYDGSKDPEDHLNFFQAAAKTERWAMPTWCHMFNSMLTRNAIVWFDDLQQESIDSYDDLRKAFLENYLQQKKCIKDPVQIHNIKQRDKESTKEFMRRAEARQIHPSYKTPKEIMALDKGKFKPPPPMTTPVEKRNASKFCEFHREVGHTTDECMHLKKKIEEMLKARKLSHLIKELKQNNRKDQTKTTKKGETSEKDKLLAILMDGKEGHVIIEAEMGGNCVHRMYVDGGSSSEILYEHCFSRFRSEVKNQMIPAATPLVGFSGEIIWPLGQISLLVKIGDEEHSTSVWMNFMVVRSPSPYNGIIRRPRVRNIRAIPSTAHGMLKFPVTGGIVTLQSSKIIPLECTMVSGARVSQPVINQVIEEKIQVAIHPEYPEQTVAIGSTLTEGDKRSCAVC